MKATNIAMPMFFEDEVVRPEFASAAVVYVPDAHDPQAREIEAWARHASRSSGFGASEAAEDDAGCAGDESVVEILCRVAASLVR
jgi:hypothetical protein